MNPTLNEEPAAGPGDTAPGASEPSAREIASQERHFLVLLVTIAGISLAQVVFGPALTDSRLLGWLQLLVIGATIYAAGGRKNLTVATLILGIPALISRIVSVSITAAEAELASMSLSMVFIGYVIWVIGTAIARAGRVTADKIYGAICVYLLLGALWTSAYCILEIANPGSFSFPEGAVPEALVEQSDYRYLEHQLGYFSYVTLTTLGYGDITPVTRRAQHLAWMEAVVGQLFIAVTIARLVGTHIASESEGRS